MTNNETEYPVVVLYDRHERGVIRNGKQYLVVYGKDGVEHTISEKRQHLWDIFINSNERKPYLFIYREYNGVKYVNDVQPITDLLMQRAITDITTRLSDNSNEERNRSVALSYSVTLAVADKVSMNDLYTNAHKNWLFMKGISNDSDEDNSI